MFQLVTMNTSRNPLFIALLGLLSIAASAVSFAAVEKCADKSKAAGAAPELALKWAMSMEEVRQVMGQPDEIRSMPSPHGKAEVWVFNRTIGDRIEQMVVGTAPIMSTTTLVIGSCKEKQAGPMIEQKIGEVTQYGKVHVRSAEKIEVLLFNEHFVKAKITPQEVRSFN